MKYRVMLSLVLIAGLALPLSAQTPPASPGLGGPAVAGVCLLSREAIFTNAKIGVAATARLKQLAQAAQAEVDADRKPLEAEIQAFEAGAAKLTPEERSSRQAALAARLSPVQAKAQQRGREIEATRTKALQRIATEAQPSIAQVYKAKACGLLVDRNSVLGGNMANDLTPAVVQALDARIQTISFERENLPVAPASALR